MGLLSTLLTLPFAPIKGVIWLGEVIQDQVEQAMHDPVNVRRELEEIDEASSAGTLSEEQKEEAQQAVLNRMIRPRAGEAATAGRTEHS